MQQDLRRSDSVTVRAEPEPKASGFARALFQFGTGKRRKAAPAVEPGRLQNRLKEVLERDRAHDLRNDLHGIRMLLAAREIELAQLRAEVERSRVRG